MIRRWRERLAFLAALAPTALWGLIAVLLTAVGVGIAYWMHHRQIGVITDLEVLDFLQVVANVADGKGIKTFILRPIALTPQSPIAPMTDLYHPPLPLFLWGAAFAFLGHTAERYSAYLAGALVGLTATFLAVATAQLTNRWAAFMAVVLFLGAPTTLLVAGLGHPAALAMCLFALWMAVVAGRSTWTNRFALLNGFLLGLAAMAQGLSLLAAPVVLMSRRWQPSGARWVFALALLLTVLPYAVRNWRWAGHPFSPWKAYAFLLDTRPFPGDSIYRHAFEQPPSPFRLAIENARWIAAKAKENLKRLRQIISSWGWVLVVGTILNALLWRRWAGLGLQFPTALMVTMLPTSLLLLLKTRVNLFAISFLVPLACLLTVVTATSLAESLASWQGWQRLDLPLALRWWMPSLTAFALSLPLLGGQGQGAWALIQSLVPIRFNPAFSSAAFGARLLPAKGVLATDEPRWLAFYWRRPLVWLPCHRSDWERLSLDKKVTHFWVSPSALLQVGGDADRALRVALVLGQPFLNRFYPVALRTAPQTLALTPFLIAAKAPAPDGQQPPEVQALYRQPLETLQGEFQKAMHRKETARALLLASVILQRQPNYPHFFNLGNVFLAQGRWMDAIRAYQAALGEAPSSFAAANNLAWAYLQLAETLARRPGWDWQANLMLRQADNWANYALDRCPDERTLAQMLSGSPDDPKARTMAQETIAQLLDTAGWVDFMLGRTMGNRPQVRWRLKRALQRLQRAHQLLPDHPDIKYHLGMVYTELGRSDLAQRYLPKR